MRLPDHPALLPLRPVAGRYTRPRMELKRRSDQALDSLARRRGVHRALDEAAVASPSLDVLVVGVEGSRSRMCAAIDELRGSRHRVHAVVGTLADAPTPGLEAVTARAGMRGPKFQNVNALIEQGLATMPAPRWTLVIDHDVILPDRFLDRFIVVAERFGFVLCQPALTLRSYYSHAVTRRRPGAVARETRFVEIGPLTAFRGEAYGTFLPFPEDGGMGWGLDLHWPAVAASRGWRLGVVDATPIGHEDAAPASAYSWDAAMAAADAFLEGRDRVQVDVRRARAIRTYRSLS